ncbi:MAG: dihydrolipoamide acetyltransferase family protein [Deltaproteobacteria bacterium]
MLIELRMPKIGLTMTEAKVIEWRKGVGDRVEAGEVVYVFETEKTTFDVEAPRSGFLARVVVEVDDTVPVGAVVGLMTESQDEKVEWTGAAAAPPTPGGAPGPVTPTPAGERLLEMTSMRRLIAERMLASKRETAQAYMTASIDATRLLETRDALAGAVEKATGARLTLTDLLLKALAAAAAAHPTVNSRWTDEGILLLGSVHMGVAVAIDDGLLVPVIRDIGAKPLAEVARERADLVERGRSGRLLPDETRGSTLTLSSLGMLGVEEFSAILNPPESAILAVGAIRDTPVVVDRQVVIRPVMKVTLTYDHRIIDGAVAARFLTTFRERVEGLSEGAA